MEDWQKILSTPKKQITTLGIVTVVVGIVGFLFLMGAMFELILLIFIATL